MTRNLDLSHEPDSTPAVSLRSPDDSPLQVREVYLHAGQTRCSRDPLVLSMILGSSVGVCLFDHQLSIGGATHFLLPEFPQGAGTPSCRYGDVAVQELVGQLRSLGSKPANLTARVFGGACMFQSFRENGRSHVGHRNAVIAVEMLSRLSIRVIEKDVAGNLGRKVKMWSNTGAVVVEVVGS